jgi:hypothetical protein
MTQSQGKFTLLRSVLKTLGLSPEAVDDIVDRIVDFLSDKDEKPQESAENPYFVRDDFLSAAEQSFYLVLKSAVADWALICPKVSLGDLFYAKSKDPSAYRTYTNKIDRKHVDFLLCDPKTARPLMGIELDDKSHRREDRQVRDEFVGQVFAAAQLPLVRVPVRQSYSVAELNALLRQHASSSDVVEAPAKAEAATATTVAEQSAAPHCPKCGSEMVLRTARSGANQGGQFWGCPDYPRCRGILPYQAPTAS